MTRRELFSLCGKLIGHYPVAVWLRVACSYMKRHCAGTTWDDEAGDTVLGWHKSIMERIRSKDPVLMCGKHLLLMVVKCGATQAVWLLG